jgi:hypothetical protein
MLPPGTLPISTAHQAHQVRFFSTNVSLSSPEFKFTRTRGISDDWRCAKDAPKSGVIKVLPRLESLGHSNMEQYNIKYGLLRPPRPCRLLAAAVKARTKLSRNTVPQQRSPILVWPWTTASRRRRVVTLEAAMICLGVHPTVRTSRKSLAATSKF